MIAGTNDARSDIPEAAAPGLAGWIVPNSLNEVVGTTLRTLVPGFADYAFVHVAAQDGSLTVAAAHHANPELEPVLQRFLSGARGRMTAPGGPIDQVLQSGEPKFSHSGPGVRHRRPKGRRTVLDVLGPRSYVAVPLVQADRLLGVLTLARFETALPFQPGDVRVTSVVARQMVKLIEARNHEAVQDEHIENLADQLISIRESLAGELAAARDGLTRARREREASNEAREQAIEALQESEEARSAAEAALADSRNRSTVSLGVEGVFLDAIDEAVIATDLDGRIEYWNRAAERLYGWTRDEAIGRDLNKAAPAVASQEQAAEAMAKMTAGESWSAEIRACRKDGTTFPVAFKGKPIYGADENPVGLVIVLSDLTHARSMDRSVTSADAPTPTEEPSAASPDRGFRQVTSLNTIVLDIEPALRSIVGDKITFEVALDADPDWVDAEPRQVARAITALVANSKDLGTEVGLISIRSENVQLKVSDLGEDADRVRAGPYVAVLVQDDGVGTDRGSRQGVFEGSTSPRAAPDGGVATAQALVEGAGGYMWVSSAPSQGTTVRIMFPMSKASSRTHAGASPTDVEGSPEGDDSGADQQDAKSVADRAQPHMPASETTANQPAQPTPKEEGRAVLLVEDDPTIRGQALEVLRQDGFEVLDAKDGVEALRIWEIEQDRISMVLTDVVMPRMSGRALIDRLRTQRPDLPALFMSTYPDDAVALHGMTERKDPFIGKPFTSEALTAAVDELLTRVVGGQPA